MSRFEDCSISHVFREANKCLISWLPMQNLFGTSQLWWQVMPAELRRILCSDDQINSSFCILKLI